MLLQNSTIPISGDPISSDPGQVLLQLRSRDYHSAVCWVDSGCGLGCGPAWVPQHYLLPPAAFELGGARQRREEPHSAD